jgi:hypothetical protein
MRRAAPKVTELARSKTVSMFRPSRMAAPAGVTPSSAVTGRVSSVEASTSLNSDFTYRPMGDSMSAPMKVSLQEAESTGAADHPGAVAETVRPA